MTDYNQQVFFGPKDNLDPGDPDKKILGSEVDNELDLISTAVLSKFDNSDRASTAEAQAGTSNNVVMTPLRSQEHMVAQGDQRFAVQSNNLSDLNNAGTARTNLGLGTMATRNTGTAGAEHRTNTQNDGHFLKQASNLSELTNTSTARSNLGLGTMATRDTGTAGSQHRTNTQNDGHFLKQGSNLSDLNNASTARTNLGLGSAAVQNDTRYAHRSNNLSDLGSASTARNNLGLGELATQDASAVWIRNREFTGTNASITDFAVGDSVQISSGADITFSSDAPPQGATWLFYVTSNGTSFQTDTGGTITLREFSRAGGVTEVSGDGTFPGVLDYGAGDVLYVHKDSSNRYNIFYMTG